MSEVEKLRALLAEARAITQDSLDSNTTGFDEQVCRCDACERYRSIIKRIDAALAEPVSPVLGENARLDAMWQQLVRERDEARAERAQLRARLVECRPFVGFCPLNSEDIQQMILVRHLADDTLAEVK